MISKIVNKQLKNASHSFHNTLFFYVQAIKINNKTLVSQRVLTWNNIIDNITNLIIYNKTGKNAIIFLIQNSQHFLGGKCTMQDAWF